MCYRWYKNVEIFLYLKEFCMLWTSLDANLTTIFIDARKFIAKFAFRLAVSQPLRSFNHYENKKTMKTSRLLWRKNIYIYIYIFLILCRDCVRIANENDVPEIQSYAWFVNAIVANHSKYVKNPSLYWQI